MTDLKALNEQHSALPNGFYLLKNADEVHVSLVKLYDHPDFNGTRHLAFGSWDGGGFLPLTDLRQDSVLQPISIGLSQTPSNDLEVLFPCLP